MFVFVSFFERSNYHGMGRNEIDPDILALFVLTTISKVQTNVNSRS